MICKRIQITFTMGCLSNIAPSDSPNITDAYFLPDNSVVVTWSRMYFSNGEILSYDVGFVLNNGSHRFRRVLRNYMNSTITYSYGIIGIIIVDVFLSASNAYGNGRLQFIMRINTTGMPVTYMYMILATDGQ